MSNKVFRAVFHSPGEFSGFHVEHGGTVGSHQLGTENSLTGYSHKAWITAAGQLHRVYPTFQFYKAPIGTIDAPCLMQFDLWLDISLTGSQWFSPWTWTDDVTDSWGAPVTVAYGSSGYMALQHVPEFGQSQFIYQASAENNGFRFPQREVVEVSVYYGGTDAKLFLNGTIVSHALVSGRLPVVSQVHGGMYAERSVGNGTCFNSNLLVIEVTSEEEALSLITRRHKRVIIPTKHTLSKAQSLMGKFSTRSGWGKTRQVRFK